MSAGFRKSFLGYNCDDVLKYIEKTTRENSEREIVDKEKISELSVTLAELESTNAELSAQIDELKKKIVEFEAKSNEIKQLREGIGILYLISKTNAQGIIDAANQSGAAVLEQVNKNIETIDFAHRELMGIRNKVEQNAADFSSNLSELESSLSKVKLDIERNASEIEVKNSEFTSVISNI